MWATKIWQAKKKYRDLDYLKTLRRVISEPQSSNVPNPEAVAMDITNAKRVARLNGKVQVSKVSQKATLTMITNWVRKVEDDVSPAHVNSISVAY